ncbi:histidine phosphatase family protein [Planotetraspora mira]|uniref:Putative phosphoglycerate mutase GpmB n=1 Tax=Planotetraspora mira TaxID=58121 RepID=A0A8J3TML8_9ACTN|nr:histidine phosphatase family protein [Planotetraspora mira]GII29218.1 putative phosphoglycerate mutase GpmB [Planotetraspora mira]
MTTIYLARHGRTAWSVQGLYTGVSDIGLDDEGARQAGALASWAARAEPDEVVSSPLVRAVRTASGAAAAAGVELRTDPRLRELDFGIAEGRRRSELDPEVVRDFEADPAACPFPGGEDPAAGADRFTACLAELGPGRILVVAHNTILRLALCRLLGIPLADYRRRLPRIDHGSVTEVGFGPEGAALRSFNVPLGG